MFETLKRKIASMLLKNNKLNLFRILCFQCKGYEKYQLIGWKDKWYFILLEGHGYAATEIKHNVENNNENHG